MTVNMFDELVEKEQMPGFKGRFVHADRMTIVRWDIAEGAELPEHSHSQEQITTILSGEFEMGIDGQPHQMVEGSVAVIPSNTVHKGRALTSCRAFDVWSPVRDDYQ